jgi:hypothetical protein
MPASPAAASRVLPGEKATDRTGFARPDGPCQQKDSRDNSRRLTRKGIQDSSRIIVEDVDGSVLVPAGSEFTIAAQVHGHTKAA